jgi:16S rRNA (guanine527-N7)-methyltransferase
MNTARIAALLEPFLETSLNPSQLDQISTYIDLLLRWNARINLTAIRNEEEIVTRHFGESFFLARHVFPTKTPCHPERSQDMREAHVSAESKDPYLSTTVGTQGDGATGVPARPPFAGNWAPGTGHCPPRVLDIGSGAGFPALPLKIYAPDIHLTLIESNHKKAAFLREVARALTSTNINVITERAETLARSQDIPRAEVVTLRAVEHFEAILPVAVTFLADQAILALLIGATQLPQVSAATSLNWHQPINIPKSHSRILLLGYPSK